MQFTHPKLEWMVPPHLAPAAVSLHVTEGERLLFSGFCSTVAAVAGYYSAQFSIITYEVLRTSLCQRKLVRVVAVTRKWNLLRATAQQLREKDRFL